MKWAQTLPHTTLQRLLIYMLEHLHYWSYNFSYLASSKVILSNLLFVEGHLWKPRQTEKPNNEGYKKLTR